MYSMKRVKPPFTPGLKAELTGRDRGLKQTRDPAEKGARPALWLTDPGAVVRPCG